MPSGLSFKPDGNNSKLNHSLVTIELTVMERWKNTR
jgi:hypothetical protein